MAQKRMFDKAIIDTDRFMDMSMSSKALYFLLGMEADDEGFVSYKKVMRIHGGNEDDVKVLVAKKFLIAFDSGVMVITDWNKNNWLNNSRIKATEYQKERLLISLTRDKKYVLNKCLANAQLEESRGVESRVEERSKSATKKFKKPTIDEVKEYCDSRKNKIDPQRFIDFYDSKGWLIGKNKMKDWRAAVRTWERMNFEKTEKVKITKYDKFEN